MDVISFAAPDATHVNLYWSGNQTILKGWGYPEGIPRESAANSKLKKVTLHAFPVCPMFNSTLCHQWQISNLE
jgi:hypothetical protein